MHLLCQRLNELGETSLIWQPGRPLLKSRFDVRGWMKALRYQIGRTKRAYKKGPFDNPVAHQRDLKYAIVVYPEIVEGNPLGSPAVVRWLLHRPKHHTGTAVFGAEDLFFFYQEAFHDPDYDIDPSNRLTITWFIDAYKEQGCGGERSGTTYLLRKGKGRPILHDLTDSICVDDMSHEEKAAAFNRAKYFYSYDLYTMYALYAALCGCIPIIVPDPTMTKESWVPDERDRYGIAYGAEDIPWAISTRDKLLARVRVVREEQDALVRTFVRKCSEAFER